MLASLVVWLPIGLAFGLWAFIDPPHDPYRPDGSGGISLIVYVGVALLWGLVNGALLFVGGILLRLLGRHGPILLIRDAAPALPDTPSD